MAAQQVNTAQRVEPRILRSKEAIDLQPLPPALDTLPKHFIAHAHEFGAKKIAMRKKRYGIWQEFTWEDSYRIVRNMTLALVEIGMKPGEKVSIIGDNDPEFYWAELACWSEFQ